MSDNAAIVINEEDNVATALRRLEAGHEIRVTAGDKIINLIIKENINAYHKFSICDIKKDQKIYKYAEVIGESTVDINKGSHVHVHNMRSLRG